MIIRLVKLTFSEVHIEAFKHVFNEQKHLIRQSQGCRHLELWQDQANPSCFFTLSHWDEPSDLEAYRKSGLFEEIWSRVKPWFSSRPEAWTVSSLEPMG